MLKISILTFESILNIEYHTFAHELGLVSTQLKTLILKPKRDNGNLLEDANENLTSESSFNLNCVTVKVYTTKNQIKFIYAQGIQHFRNTTIYGQACL